MKRGFIVLLLLSAMVLAGPAAAQQDRLQGRWEGMVQSPQGERPASATFKKQGNSYTGAITGMRGDMAFKEIKLDGNKLAATAEVDGGQGPLPVKFQFSLEGEVLKGTGEVEFGGNVFNFTFDLKRTSTNPDAPPTAPATSQGTQTGAGGQGGGQAARARGEGVPQPTQPQSLDYFTGSWTFKWIGRESPLGPGGPREGKATFAPLVEGKFLEIRTEGKGEAGPFTETGIFGFNSERKSVLFSEQRGGTSIVALGDWSSPIAIRFDVPPLKIKGQTVRLRRTLSVVAAHSFTVTEEFSVDGSSFQRLGNGIYTKAPAGTASK